MAAALQESGAAALHPPPPPPPDAAPPPACKPFLRRGAGWEARLSAAREGRRYVPHGGHVKDYAKEEAVPPPPFMSGRGRPTAAGAPTGRKAACSRSPAKPAPAVRKLAAAAGGAAKPRTAAAGGAQRAPPRVVASPRRQHPLPAARAPPAAAAAPPAGADWARRLLQGGQPATGPPAAAPVWASRPVHEQEDALEEFEALENQVLREVHTNAPQQPRRGAAPASATGSPGKKPAPAASSRRGSAAAVAPPAYLQQPQEQQAQQQEWQPAACADDDDVFQSDDEGRVRSVWSDEGPSCAPAAGLSAVQRLPGYPPVFLEEEGEGEGEMHAESSFLHDLPSQPAPGRFFSQQQQQQQQPPQRQQQQARSAPIIGQRRQLPTSEREAVEQLQLEIVRLQEERARVARLRVELEEALEQLERDKAAWEKRKLEEGACFEGERAEELRKLQRDRRVLEKQSRALLKLPTKQSKEEVAAVEALLAEERRTGRAREARSKLTVERLRQQLLEAQGRAAELRSQVEFLEGQRVELPPGSARGSPGSGAQPPASVTAVLTAPARFAAPALAAKPPLGSWLRRPGGLPEVRVERGGGSSSVPPAAAAARQVQPLHSWTEREAAEAEEEQGGEVLIADVRLTDDEVVVCELGAAGEQQPAWQGQPETAAAAAGFGGAAGSSSDGAALDSHAWTDAGQAGEEPAAAAAGNASSRASTALARFNQLRESLVQQRGASGSSRQGSPGSAAASALPSGPPVALVAPQDCMDSGADAFCTSSSSFQPAGAAGDDLRRLGRSLMAAAAGSSPVIGQAGAALAGQEPSAATDAVVSEQQHSDGRSERLFASGLREQRFANGSTKLSAPGGAALTRFANGDVKKVPAGAGGTVQYWYAAVGSWQVTHPSGVEVFFFPSGQVEAHHPGGIKEIRFPDGALRKVLPDGRELAVSAAHLSAEVQAARPEAALDGC